MLAPETKAIADWLYEIFGDYMDASSEAIPLAQNLLEHLAKEGFELKYKD